MSDSPDCIYTDDHITIRFPKARQGVINRLLGRSSNAGFDDLPESEGNLLLAVADLRFFEHEHPGEVKISADELQISHDAAASLSTQSAQALGLPRDIHLTLRTDTSGTLGSPEFRLHYNWYHHAKRQSPKRQGAILTTVDGPRRLPLWVKRVIDLADEFDPSQPLEDHWTALAEFRSAIVEEDDLVSNDGRSVVEMDDFLSGLEVRVASGFSISPTEDLSDFDVLPYSAKTIEESAGEQISEVMSELNREQLAALQSELHNRGTRPSYNLGRRQYVVVEKASLPVLEKLVQVKKGPREERKSFVQNPQGYLSGTLARDLEAKNELEDLDDAQQEELIDQALAKRFVATEEYSARVSGVALYKKPEVDFSSSGTTWLPELFSERLRDSIDAMDTPSLEALKTDLETAIDANSEIELNGETITPTPILIKAIAEKIAARRLDETQTDSQNDELPSETDGTRETAPVILETQDNYEDIKWRAEHKARQSRVAAAVPESVTTPLHPHQKECFNWAIDAWQSGLPGVLNADEQGLGKTLQTIAFLTWLKGHMSQPEAAERGPVLVVAPTTLLKNWEEEVERHVAEDGFGHVLRLYGGGISATKRRGAAGVETTEGQRLLDLDWLHEALKDGRAHRHWVLTTYQTLCDYQHSLGAIPFSAAVFDEVQAVKNRATIRYKAATALNADFRIGLTGTPIENSTMDLWTIMDVIAPGALGSGQEFRKQYGDPTEQNMSELHARMFRPVNGAPALGIRRLKDGTIKNLPSKTRLLHPKLMPEPQAECYDLARAGLQTGRKGSALKQLHHIRSVSVHPWMDTDNPTESFISDSARLKSVIEILDRISKRGERALVFIENLKMQFRFAEILRQRYDLADVGIINGKTAIKKRQQIVNKFQEHLKNDRGFDALVLSPKAAGTGLTLTAATHVIHLSRWWNPAVEEQCNDRVHRIGQQRPVEVHVPMAVHPRLGENSFDGLLQSLMVRKGRVAQQALWPMGDTKEDAERLQSGLGARPSDGMQDISKVMEAQFLRDGIANCQPRDDGGYPFS